TSSLCGRVKGAPLGTRLRQRMAGHRVLRGRGGGTDPVAPRLLCGIKRGIRTAPEVGKAFDAVGLRNSKACRKLGALRNASYWKAGKGHPQAFGEQARRGEVRAGQKYRELLTADTRRGCPRRRRGL